MLIKLQQTRSISYVPGIVLVILISALILQCVWHYQFSNFEIKTKKLPSAPGTEIIRLISLDDSVTAAKVAMLWLQAFDNQPGTSIPLKELSYDKVIEWLELMLKLDKHMQYPLFAAIRFYAEVRIEEKQRKMVRFVMKKFLEDPNERWPAMAHAVFISKHRIKDEQLAVECARLLRLHANSDQVPYWAKQMEFFVLEDMGELEQAMILIGGLLESGKLDDPHQEAFLKDRLNQIEDRLSQDIQ